MTRFIEIFGNPFEKPFYKGDWPENDVKNPKVIYEAEHEFLKEVQAAGLAPLTQFKSVERCHEWLFKVAVSGKWADLKLPTPPRVERCFSRVYSEAYGLHSCGTLAGTIRLNKRHYNEYYICHELAHACLAEGTRHGLRWRVGHLILVEEFISTKHSLLLAKKFTERGLL